MSRRLAQILVTDQHVAQSDVEEALQRQILYGGGLDTNLLESTAIPEAALLAALSEATGLPAAGKAEIDAIGPHVPRLFPQVFAETYHLVPFALDGSVLKVLVAGDPDPQLLQKIHERLALTPSPVITSEVRLHYAMNQLYGIELLPRINALVSKLDGTMVLQDAGERSGRNVLSWGLGASPARPSGGASSNKRVNIRELLSRLDFAADRDAIVDILLAGVTSVFDFSALFLIQPTTVTGWRGHDMDATTRVARISIPIDLPSVFQTIYATQGHYLGPLPDNNINNRLLSDMGRQRPRAALVAPMVIGGRLSVIVYADNAERPVSPRRVAGLLVLTQRSSLAFERLIRKRKVAAERMIARSDDGGSDDMPIEFDLAEDGTMSPGADEAISRYPSVAPAAAKEVDRQAWATETLGTLDASPAATRAAFERGLEDHVDDVGDIDDDYVAFADVDDDADDSLDGWGDVLIETADALGVESTVSAERAAAPQAAPPTVSWDDVIREAMSAAQWVPRAPSGPIEVAGTLVDETEILLDGLLAADAQVRREAVERLLLLGPRIDERLRERFPGAIDFDPLDPGARIPPFGRCSGITELLLARGVDSVGVVMPFLEHDDPAKRFFAIYFLLAVNYPGALEPLARRLYDTEPRNRHLAADTLRGYAKEPGYQRIVAGLREQLRVPVIESRIAAVQLLGQLRDPASVPELIPLAVAPEAELAQAVVSALTVICGQEFGYDVPGWSQWWRGNYNRPRPAWLLQGLRHPSVDMRRLANYELQLLTGMTTHYDPDAHDAEREEKVRMWESWWAHVSGGRASGDSAAATG